MLVRALGKGCFWFPAQHERNTMKESHREVAKPKKKFNFTLVLLKEILSGT